MNEVTNTLHTACRIRDVGNNIWVMTYMDTQCSLEGGRGHL